MNTQPVNPPACPHTAGTRARLIMEAGAVSDLPDTTTYRRHVHGRENVATRLAPAVDAAGNFSGVATHRTAGAQSLGGVAARPWPNF
jgi:enterochelin esterase-like enzyme